MFLVRRYNRGPYEPGNCVWSRGRYDDNRPEGEPTQREKPVVAWGETKVLSEWLVDSRSVIAERATFYTRLHRGWSVEDALSKPAERANGTEISIFGESKTILAWSKDPRCAVPYATLLSRRSGGWELERALTESVRGQLYRIGGITKPAKEWLKDPIAMVASYRTLARRLAQGWGFEEALTTGDGRSRPRADKPKADEKRPPGPTPAAPRPCSRCDQGERHRNNTWCRDCINLAAAEYRARRGPKTVVEQRTCSLDGCSNPYEWNSHHPGDFCCREHYMVHYHQSKRVPAS